MNCKTAMTLMMLSGIATTAWGDVVIHENGNPMWFVSEMAVSGCSISCEGEVYNPLNITLSSQDQVEASRTPIDIPPADSLVFYRNSSFHHTGAYGLRVGSNVQVAGELVEVDFPGGDGAGAIPAFFVDEITPIDGTIDFAHFRCEFFVYKDADVVIVSPVAVGEYVILPLQIEQTDGTHYGFVELYGTAVLQAGGFPTLIPTRWGYETTPDLPFMFPVEQCGPADFDMDGQLNFFDMAAFLEVFLANDSSADLNNDGEFNFFDVSAFLAAFAAGCP